MEYVKNLSSFKHNKIITNIDPNIKGDSVQTPSQVILSKLNTMGASWADFFISNVVERPGRADIFKEQRNDID